MSPIASLVIMFTILALGENWLARFSV